MTFLNFIKNALFIVFLTLILQKTSLNQPNLTLAA